jgi:hypothetical protein
MRIPALVVSSLLVAGLGTLVACSSLQSIASDVRQSVGDAKSVIEIIKALVAQLQQVLAFLLEMIGKVKQTATESGLSTEAVLAIAGGTTIAGGMAGKFMGGKKGA